eukprot:5529115-Alexandrium_andersonii.AAC.1
MPQGAPYARARRASVAARHQSKWCSEDRSPHPQSGHPRPAFTSTCSLSASGPACPPRPSKRRTLSGPSLAARTGGRQCWRQAAPASVALGARQARATCSQPQQQQRRGTAAR